MVVKLKVKPEHADGFMDLVGDYTRATRAEEGNLWFEWSRSVEDPNEFVLVEAYRDGTYEAHATSGHFATGLEAMQSVLASTPKIISRQVEGDDWDEAGALQTD
ncbi:antibiotic biosynthesis monooxygenase [Nocardioides sp. PD653]|nr:antibiotic biosynthesis monooxygenase [Nocardioides sp. PD653-B2]GAW55660.1 antibiotic biosynthesis monooxygenase [Nocardioides sp. PD653]